MNNDFTTRAMKLFAGGLAGLILLMAAFAGGVGVGARLPGRPAALLPAPTVAATLPPAPTLGKTLTPPPASPLPALTPTPRAAAPRPTAGSNSSSKGMPLDTALLDEVWGLLQKQFYGDVPLDDELTYNAIRGIVDRLGDQHTAFVDPKAAALMNAEMEGAFEGIGARVEKDATGGVLISYLFANQPAEKAGIKIGDVIIAVDGKDVTPLGLTEAISMIRGPKGTSVALTIHRAPSATPIEIKVTRARIEIPVVESKTLADGKIAYVSLAEFSSAAPGRLQEALRTALDKRPAGLILDMRGNPGGLLDASVRIGSFFVPEGNILIERMKDGTERKYARQGSYLLGNTKLVVLVDSGSASAAEIVAGAIQDAGKGVLIGEKTYGKGSVQIPNNLSDGSQLRVTIAHWFTPKDRAIHGVGLIPDIAVPLTAADREAKRDPQLDRAVQYLTTGK